MQNKTGFTLVELIVVITILSVLATIGFISFTGYGASARDSVRLSDIHNIEKSLGIYKIKEGKYPEPDNKVDVKSSGATLTYQGYAGKKVLGLIGVHGGGVDPITGDYYTLVTNIVRTKYQLLSYFENEENITKQTSFISKAKASLIDRYPQLSGDKLGIIINNITKEPLQTTGMDLDISKPTSTYEAHLSNNEVITGDNVSLGTMYSKSSCNRLKEFDNTLADGKYMIDPLADGNEFEVLCDMTTDGGGWTLYTAKNKYNYPDIGYFNIEPLKQNIKFSKIRWNFVSPQGKHLPLIYRIFNQKEGNLLLEHNEGVQNSIFIDEINHYKTPEQFAEAFSFGINNTSGVTLLTLQEAYKNYNMTHLGAWVDGLGRNIAFLGTAYAYNKAIIKDLFRFPSNPYNGTYRMGEEIFTSVSTGNHWVDGRSIAIWIK